MTATSDKLATGGAVVCWVLAIEGYDKLITNWPDTAAVVTAWSGTDWSTAISGLEVKTQFEQSIRPLEPQMDFSSATFLIHDGRADDFGTSIFAQFKNTGNASPLASSVDPSDTSIEVLTETDFASSGTAYVGPENFAYTGTTTGTLTGCTRGKYTPFGTNTSSRWARAHRVVETSGVPTFAPIVSDWKRVWIGSHVGLWLHVVEDDVLNTKAEAQLIFAGTIADVVDEIGATRLVCTDFRNGVARRTLFENQFSCSLTQGIWLEENDRIEVQAVAWPAAGGSDWDRVNLTGADFSAPAQVTVKEILDAINTEIAGLTLGADDFTVGMTPDGRFTAYASWSGTYLSNSNVMVRGTPNMLNILGINNTLKKETDSDLKSPGDVVTTQDTSDPSVTLIGAQPVAWAQPTLTFGGTLEVKDSTGVFLDQADYMPEPIRSDLRTATSGVWGFMQYAGFTFAVKWVSDTELIVYWDNNVLDLFEQKRVGHVEDIIFPLVRVNEEPPRMKQVVYWVDTLDNFITKVFASTGDTGYNHGSWDLYPKEMGAAVPWALLGNEFLESVREMTEAGAPDVSVLLDKPVTISELLAPEMALRNSHLVFRDGGLVFVKFAGETLTADHTLTDSDLSAPADSAQDERPVSWWTKDHIVNSLKIEYDRSIGGNFRSVVELVNSTSVGEFGTFPITISARNILTIGEGAKDLWIYSILEDLGSQILATFDEPLQFVRMTVQGSKIFGMAPGDTVSLSSDWIRYHGDGSRGVSGVFGVITDVSYDLNAYDGEVTILLTGGELERSAAFAPVANIDSTYTSGAFTAGYDGTGGIIKVEQHAYSLSSEDKDVTYYEAGDKVRVIERNPATAASPQSWDTEVYSVDTANDEITLYDLLTGFDTSKRYMIISDTYADTVTAQKAESYFADITDDKIDGTDRSKMFRSLKAGTALITQTGTSSGQYEFPPINDQWSGPGRPLHAAIYRTLETNFNQFIGIRSAPENPGLCWPGNLSPAGFNKNGFYGMVWVVYFPIGHYGETRNISVGPRMRSSSVGVTVNLKVRSSAYAPTRASSSGTFGDAKTIMKQEVTFSTTSTSFTNVTSQLLPIVTNYEGGTWISLHIESGTAALHLNGFHTLHLTELS